MLTRWGGGAVDSVEEDGMRDEKEGDYGCFILMFDRKKPNSIKQLPLI